MDTIMKFEDFRAEVLSAMDSKPKDWRDGQFVFNYIDEHYAVARYTQFVKGINCFFDDSKIEVFIKGCYEILVAAIRNQNLFGTE